MQITNGFFRKIVLHPLLSAVMATACAGPCAAQNDAQLRRLIGGFVSVGGYFLTSSSGRNAIGGTKFFSDTALYVRPAHKGPLLITGGVEIVSANDHFFPFSGGDEFSLIGPSFRVTTQRVQGRLRPYVSAGLFAGRVRSEQLGFDRTDFTPSASLGVDWPFARYFTLSAGYRISKDIHGANLDGFNVSLRVF